MIHLLEWRVTTQKMQRRWPTVKLIVREQTRQQAIVQAAYQLRRQAEKGKP